MADPPLTSNTETVSPTVTTNDASDNEDMITSASISTTKTVDKKKRKVYSSILDSFYFDPDHRQTKVAIVLSSTLKRFRHRLLYYLQKQDYQSGFALLAALVESCRYPASSYWKVAEEIVRHYQPEEDLTLFLQGVVTAVKMKRRAEPMKEFLAQLLEERGYQAVHEQLESDKQRFENDSTFNKFFGMVIYEEWKHRPTKALLRDAETQLAKAYALNTSDRHIIKAYLEVIQASSDDAESTHTEGEQHGHGDVMRQLTGRISKTDAELISNSLYYCNQGVIDTNLGESVCQADPVADPEIAFLPMLKAMKSRRDGPIYIENTMRRLGLICDRLEHGALDRPTLNELGSFLAEVPTMIPLLQSKVFTFILSADLSTTLRQLQEEEEEEEEVENENGNQLTGKLDMLEYLIIQVDSLFPKKRNMKSFAGIKRPWSDTLTYSSESDFHHIENQQLKSDPWQSFFA